MRLFLAVFPPPALQEAAHAAAEPLRRAGEGVSWVSPGNLHYTMRFLGEVGPDEARRAGEAAVEAAASVAAFECALGGFGAFPDPGRARVIWIGMSAGAESLTVLAAALDHALARRGFARLERPFSPHLTLGRVRDPGADWSQALGGAPALEGPRARFTVERLDLVESALSTTGSIYWVRAQARLSG